VNTAKTIPQHLQSLRDRGLVIGDDVVAARFLTNVSYYRFSSYAKYFESTLTADRSFLAGTTFDDVCEMYKFDELLRRIVWKAICSFETAFKTRFGNQLALTLGDLSYKDPANFAKIDLFIKSDDLVDETLKSSKEPFVEKFFEEHAGDMPPVWLAFEVLSLGVVSKLLSNLKDPKFASTVAQEWGLNSATFQNAVYQISLMRNATAHHGKLWGRHFSARGAKVTHPRNLSVALDAVDNRSTYWVLVQLHFMLQTCDPTSSFERDVLALLGRFPRGALHVGVPNGIVPVSLMTVVTR